LDGYADCEALAELLGCANDREALEIAADELSLIVRDELEIAARAVSLVVSVLDIAAVRDVLLLNVLDTAAL
jgi:hypothetical protein